MYQYPLQTNVASAYVGNPSLRWGNHGKEPHFGYPLKILRFLKREAVLTGHDVFVGA